MQHRACEWVVRTMYRAIVDADSHGKREECGTAREALERRDGVASWSSF